MAFRFNPFTGQLDEVDIPLPNGTVIPTLSGNGDERLAEIVGDGRIYWEVNGNTYYVSGIKVIPLVRITGGQPIPIGMGLTMTYANGVS